MITDFKPYPAYKDSGVPWLGKVPKHWDVVPNRALIRLKKQIVGERADNYTLLSLTKRGIIARDMENPEGKFPTSFETYQVVGPGDLIFCLFDIDETPRAVGLSSMNGMITGAYTRFVCADESTRRYIYLLYLSLDNSKLLKPLYSGLRKVITKSTFLSAKLALPPLPEQAAIVSFLDHADRRIRRYIRAKQKLVKLLQEQKQAIIHHAVTRGLNPDVRLKPSGIYYLENIPDKWKLRRFKTIARINRGQVDPREPQYRDLTLVAPNHIETRTAKLLSVETANQQGADSGKYLVRKGQIIYSKIRPNLRKATIAPFDCLCSADMYAISFDKTFLLPEYAILFLLSDPFSVYTEDCSMRVAMPKINREALGQGWFCFPSLEEQSLILQKINSQTRAMEKTIKRAKLQIDLMREYHTRIIADVVTGKVDVRDILVEAVSEDEELEELAATEEMENDLEVEETQHADD